MDRKGREGEGTGEGTRGEEGEVRGRKRGRERRGRRERGKRGGVLFVSLVFGLFIFVSIPGLHVSVNATGSTLVPPVYTHTG